MSYFFLPLLICLLVNTFEVENPVGAHDLEINFQAEVFELGFYPNLLEVDNSLGRFQLLILLFRLVVFEHSLVQDEVSLLPSFVEAGTLFFHQPFMRIIGC